MSPSLGSIKVVAAADAGASGIGKYRYIARLAEGGMAEVFLGLTKGQSDFEKLVVIKELRQELTRDPTFVAMFTDEARLAARLNHPNVVQTLEVGSQDGRHFIAMEYLEGISYTKLLRRKDRLPAPLAIHVRILADVLYGLDYAHELKDFDGAPLHVVHRDVSPQNVMLTFAGGVKVLDFGIAKAALAAEQRPDDFKGKLEYMAPEQALLLPVDRRGDIFSVGVMLWEALARRRFYKKGEAKMARLTTEDAPDVLAARPEAPRMLAKVCMKALSRDPDARYPTAAEMAHELEEWLDGTSQHVRARDVSGYVTETFAATRAKVSAAIEQQLAVIRALPEDAPASIPLRRIADDTSFLPPPLDGSEFSRAGWSQTPARLPSRSRALFAIGAGVLAALALVGASTAIFKKARRTPEVVASAATSASAETDVDITVRASPPEATIAIDGQVEPKNPAVLRRKKDDATHVVHVEAPGFEPRDETLTFDTSLHVSIDLRPATAPSGSASGRRPPRRLR